MAKKFVAEVRFQVPGGKATPAPPVGTSLGQYGVNLGMFVKQFNDKTKESEGLRIPVVVKVYDDRSFELTTKSPAAVDLLKRAAGISKGSGKVPKEKVGVITKAQIDEIVAKKQADLNARNPEHARFIIMGTARSMGLDVVD